jgi:hypothetical protein
MTGVLPHRRHRTRTAAAGRAPQRTGAADLAREVRDVVTDLSRSLTAPPLRPGHRTWGATPAEVAAPVPRDEEGPGAQYRCARAITIGSPPEEVWPWLVQVGCLRADRYADGLLDDLGHPSARRVAAELQDVHVGTELPTAPDPTGTTASSWGSRATPR